MAVVPEEMPLEIPIPDQESEAELVAREMAISTAHEIRSFFTTDEIGRIDRHQQRVASNLGALVLRPLPIDIERNHTQTDIDVLTQKRPKFDRTTEEQIGHDAVILSIRSAALEEKERLGRINPQFALAYRVRRSIVTTLLHKA
jgi:hypothetical protein